MLKTYDLQSKCWEDGPSMHFPGSASFFQVLNLGKKQQLFVVLTDAFAVKLLKKGVGTLKFIVVVTQLKGWWFDSLLTHSQHEVYLIGTLNT